ncbi:hypothetical protein CC86DRAFT_204310 [Ophiobolus disseminans]|uniref:Rhodopsin domain-containing protein n=1 Tax=Ophiobolus disseminans TaxID=1469910 RepID=A0A6A7A5J2_9PLEO|nr:hypothetical protein CC86DRAFT_204310 [Ophiobolus disseminans]
MNPTTSPSDPWTIPVHEPPPGVVSDFNQRSDLLDLTIAIVSIMLFFTVSILALRFWANWGPDTWKMDDWCALITSVVTLALGGVVIPVVGRFGKPDYNIPLGLMVLSIWFQRVTVAFFLVSAFATFLGKCCVLTLYYRLFGSSRPVRYQIYIVLVLSLTTMVIGIVIGVIWSPGPWSGRRRLLENLKSLLLILPVMSFIIDLVILLMPIPLIVRLNLSRRKKGAVLALFMTGAIAIAADGVAIYYRSRFYSDTGCRDASICALCSFIEAAVSIIVSSMPSAAKTWNQHITNSTVFIFICSKLGISNHTDVEVESMPSDFKKAKAKAAQKKRRGLWSLPSILTGGFSNVQASQKEFKSSRPDLEKRIDSPGRFSLHLNDPSNYIERPSAV